MSQDYVSVKVDGKEYTFDVDGMDEHSFNGQCSYRIKCISSSPAPASLRVGNECNVSVSFFGNKYEGKLKYSGSGYFRDSGFYTLYFEGTGIRSVEDGVKISKGGFGQINQIIKELDSAIQEFDQLKRKYPRMKTQDVIDLLRRLKERLEDETVEGKETTTTPQD